MQTRNSTEESEGIASAPRRSGGGEEEKERKKTPEKAISPPTCKNCGVRIGSSGNPLKCWTCGCACYCGKACLLSDARRHVDDGECAAYARIAQMTARKMVLARVERLAATTTSEEKAATVIAFTLSLHAFAVTLFRRHVCRRGSHETGF